MKHLKRIYIRPLLFTLGGSLTGLLYYQLANCASGACPITSNPVTTMLYMGIIGWLINEIISVPRR